VSNRERFLAEYKSQLARAVADYPAEYVWPISELEVVFGRMVAAFDRGSYSKDSRAFKATCKTFGIKHTYSAIAGFVAL
jgi:hypothetical protein